MHASELRASFDYMGSDVDVLVLLEEKSQD